MAGVILVTGASGYIGTALRAYLSRNTDKQLIEVSRATGIDMTRPGWTENLPPGSEDAEVVLHLAQSRLYRQFPQGAQDIFRVNTAATLELAEWARQHKVRRFLYSSTGSVYAQGAARQKMSEEAATDPATMYAASKLSGEALLKPYRELFEVVVMRLFSVYGPAQGQMLIANMVERVQSGAPITLAGGEGLFLTPLYVEDCVRVLARLADVELENTYQLLNLCGDEVLSLREMVAQIVQNTGKPANLQHTDGTPPYFCGDNSRLKAYYDSFTPFETGIQAVLAAN